MPVERSAGAIIFREDKSGRKYLLLHHHPSTSNQGGSWGFPKGHIDKGEKTEETVRREVKEETGVSRMKILPGFKETIRYFVGSKEERHLKFVAFFLAKTKTRNVKISWEHIGYTWLPYQEAHEKLTYKNEKEILEKADEFLSKSS